MRWVSANLHNAVQRIRPISSWTKVTWRNAHLGNHTLRGSKCIVYDVTIAATLENRNGYRGGHTEKKV